jgi:hypothetical protein
MSPFLSDAELQDVTHRRQPCAQARALDRIGVPFKRRPDGTLLVGRTALDRALSGGAQSQPANGIKWSKAA